MHAPIYRACKLLVIQVLSDNVQCSKTQLRERLGGGTNYKQVRGHYLTSERTHPGFNHLSETGLLESYEYDFENQARTLANMYSRRDIPVGVKGKQHSKSTVGVSTRTIH